MTERRLKIKAETWTPAPRNVRRTCVRAVPCTPGWSRRIPLRQHPVAVPRSKMWAGSCRESTTGGVQGDVTGDFISSQFSTGFAVPLRGSGACRLSKKQFQGGIFQAPWTDFWENTSPEGRGSQGLGCLDAGSPPRAGAPMGCGFLSSHRPGSLRLQRRWQLSACLNIPGVYFGCFCWMRYYRKH